MSKTNELFLRNNGWVNNGKKGKLAKWKNPNHVCSDAHSFIELGQAVALERDYQKWIKKLL